MKEFFTGRVVFITGSSKGIGKATAVLLGSYGAKICLNGRNKGTLARTAEELSAKGIDCIKLPGDISDSDQCKRMVEEILNKYGRLEVLINNAAIASQGKFIDSSPEAWTNVIGINTLGSIYPTIHALPHLLAAKGSVIFISTLAGKLGMPGHSTYSVSKMGLTALAKAMQIEHDKKTLHTGIIYVGLTENDADKKIQYPDGSSRPLKPRGLKTASRESVALEIARVIYNRKRSVTLSNLGKLQALSIKFFPFILKIILKKANRDYDSMYD
jgi:short-subunit dehydrogenase